MILKTIYLAGGCFWGIAHLFSLVPGVTETQAGYANSIVPDPTYQQVCTGRTDAAETVKVVYDAEQIDLPSLLDLYFESIDPTTEDRQGNDVGSQYRTGIYCVDETDLPIVQSALKSLQRKYAMPIVVESGMLQNFYPAEEYHQDYLYKNPRGYCHVGPELFRKAKTLVKRK